MTWLYLVLVILLEVSGTTCMKLSEGFTKGGGVDSARCILHFELPYAYSMSTGLRLRTARFGLARSGKP